MSDKRLRYFANVSCMKSGKLPKNLLNTLDNEVSYRLTTDEPVPWMTIGKALEEIILPECNEFEADLLDE